MKIEKVPSLKCKQCGGFRVIMTEDGPECDDCDAKPQTRIPLSKEVEYFIYQLNNKEFEEDETF